jgi:hypothetical protein
MGESRLLATACCFLLLLAAGHVFALLCFATGTTIAAPGMLAVVAGAVATTGALAVALRHSEPRALVFGVAIVAGGALLLGKTFDITWDGQAWHAYLIEHLRTGWNPLRTRLEPGDDLFNMIANHYPKAVEVLAAEIGGWTGRFDDGRIVHFVAMPPALLLSFACFRRVGVRGAGAAALSVLAVLNPVVVTQALTYYVDGFLYLMLLTAGASLALITLGSTGRALWASFALAAVLAVNAKPPGLVSLAVFVLAGVGALVLRRRVRAAAAVAALFAVLIVATGWHPYVQNLRGFGNPFYPSLGSDGRFALETLVSQQRPAGLQERSRGARLFLSTFGRSDGSSQPPRPKAPWSVDRRELDAFVHPDVRSGGFGPLFALALLCALAAAGTGTSARDALRRWSLPAILLASALVHADAWWARYAPQLWLVPLVATATALADGRTWRRRLARAVVVILALDVTLVAHTNLGHTLWESRRMRRQLARAKQLPEACFAIGGDYFGARARLVELGIRHLLVTEAACTPSLLLGHHTRLCGDCPPPQTDVGETR